MSPTQDLNDLVFFAEVVERGGFSAASRALDVPKSRLSRRIAQLETSLGVQLLQRSTRRLSLTPAGEVYLRHCVAVREAAEAGAAEVAQVRKEPRGLVRLSCPVTLAQSNLGPALPEFFSRHPGVQLEMRVMNRPVDPVEEGVDIALRVRNEVENSATLASRVFGRSQLLLVGTPALLARHGPLTHPESLEQVECVAMSAADARAGTLLQGPGGATHLLMQTPRYLANDLLTLSFAVERGVGIGFLPDYLCREALQAGRLQSVLPDWQPPPGLVHAMFTPRRALVPAVRAVLDFLGEVLAEAPNRTVPA